MNKKKYQVDYAQAATIFLSFSVACMGLVTMSCDDEQPQNPCLSGTVTVMGEGLSLNSVHGEALLAPFVKVDGQWRGGGIDGACRAEADTLFCPAGTPGEVSAFISNCTVVTQFVASESATIEGLALKGQARVDGATSWLSNGFQSWSQSGMLVLTEQPTTEVLEEELSQRGALEESRKGVSFSNWYTAVGGGENSLFIGATTSERFRPWVQVWRGGSMGLEVNIVSGAAGEQVTVEAGSVVYGEPFVVSFGSSVSDLELDYASRLSTRRDTNVTAPELGWNSWYDLYADVDEEAVRTNAALVRAQLGDAAEVAGQPLRIVIDDGWQETWGDWFPNEKFPSGMDGLAHELAADGFSPGIWLAPLIAHEESQIANDHPDWFVEGAHYEHSLNGRMLVLDVTNPAAAEHLANLIARVTSWGFELLKIDFLFAGAYEGPRFDDVTGIEAYRIALEIIRQASGEETVLLAVGAPPLPSFEFVDAWRLGADIAFEPIGPSWFFMLNQARSIGARWFLCHVTLCDPDPPLLRILPSEEVLTGAWIVALAGGGIFLSDDLRELEEDRTEILDYTHLMETAMSGVPAIPLDPFPTEPPVELTSHILDTIMNRNAHVLPSKWRTSTDVEVVFNISEEPFLVYGDEIPARGVRVFESF